jgi:hypothetical protein
MHAIARHSDVPILAPGRFDLPTADARSAWSAPHRQQAHAPAASRAAPRDIATIKAADAMLRAAFN